ncbi:DEKNAAC103480 [Brettanomyces naardenensis]|uniref:DEKNAAC103480 n=1 Tax=Brettanomyces naardenensis TaxID=13370 RepID=A0A448YNB7_BRENA|nr:DEKNAAC103480 [Brettanomyces naardenensis]
MTVWTVVSTAYNIYLSQKQEGVDYQYRLKLGSLIQVVVFLAMTFSVILPKSWTLFYFIFVMSNVMISAIGACLVQVGLIAMVNIQGSFYANANVVGNAVAGVLPSISMILTVLTTNQGSGGRTSQAIKYFLTSVAVTILAMLSTEAMIRSEKHELEEEVERDEIEPEEITRVITDIQKDYVSFSHLWSILGLVEGTIILTFSITLAFPIFASSVESPTMDKKVFIPLAFLIWNLGDLAGRVVCAWPIFVLKNQRRMIVYSILRLGFIPLFLGCNIKGRGGGFIGDFAYIVLQFLFGFTNGQLFSSSFMLVGQLLDTDDEKKAAGGFTALIINVSLLVGSVMSYGVVWKIGGN